MTNIDFLIVSVPFDSLVVYFHVTSIGISLCICFLMDVVERVNKLRRNL